MKGLQRVATYTFEDHLFFLASVDEVDTTLGANLLVTSQDDIFMKEIDFVRLDLFPHVLVINIEPTFIVDRLGTFGWFFHSGRTFNLCFNYL